MSETVTKTEQEVFLVDRVGMKISRGRLASLLNISIKEYGHSRTRVGVANTTYASMFDFYLKIVVQPVSNMMHYIYPDKSKCLSNRKWFYDS